MANSISVSVLGDVRDINRKLGSVEKQLGGFGKSAGKIGGLLKGAFAGVAVGAAFKNIVSGASDAQQSLGATESVFGKFSKTVIKTSNEAATKYGLDANTYRENANLLGSLFKNQGVAVDKLAGKSKQFIGIGADLSATFGGTTTQAVEALSSALKGEFDPLEKYGVSLKQSTINAELAARGQDKLTGAALAGAKQQVLTDLVMKQSSSSRGAFAKETNTLAHQQQVLSAKFQNVKDAVGTALLPIITKFVTFLSSSALPAFQQWGQVFASKVVPALQKVGSFLGANVLPPLQALGRFMADNKTVVATFAGVILTVVAALRVWAVVQAVLNVVLTANPIGLVVVAIAALAAAFVYAYKHSKTFKNIVQAAFNGIKAVAHAVFPVVKAIVITAFRVIKTVVTSVSRAVKTVVVTAFRIIKTMVTTYVRTVKAVVTAAWRGIKAATRIWNSIKSSVVNAVRSIATNVRNKVSSAKNALSNAWNAAKSKTTSIWNGIKNAVSNKISDFMAKVRGIHGKVTGAFSGAASWLYSVGQNIIRGMINGVGSMVGALVSKASSVVGSAISAAKSKLGIKSPSTVFKAIGIYTVQGLQKGLENRSALTGVKNAAGKMTTAIGTGFESPSLQLNTAGAGTGGNYYTINIKADATTDKARLGRELVKSIEAYERQGGSRRA